jgi:hypothetical protein
VHYLLNLGVNLSVALKLDVLFLYFFMHSISMVVRFVFILFYIYEDCISTFHFLDGHE